MLGLNVYSLAGVVYSAYSEVIPPVDAVQARHDSTISLYPGKTVGQSFLAGEPNLREINVVIGLKKKPASAKSTSGR